MILILSSSGDSSIDYVSLWLDYYGAKYFRLNSDQLLSSQKVEWEIGSDQMRVDGNILSTKDVNALWFRKFGWFERTDYFKKVSSYSTSDEVKQLGREHYSLLTSIISRFLEKKWLTPPWSADLNKIHVLEVAKEEGFVIPSSMLCCSKNQLIEFRRKHENGVISKSIFEPFFNIKPEGIYDMFTRELSESMILDLPTDFQTSLIQEKIEKQYEIRTFYINGNFFSMMIHSQNNSQTKIDFRIYDVENPNRNVPYRLPEDVKEKLKNVFRKLNLNCCSVDIIKCANTGEYVFLEINPTGQFGMVGSPCNYPLGKTIARTLIDFDSQRNNNDNKVF